MCFLVVFSLKGFFKVSLISRLHDLSILKNYLIILAGYLHVAATSISDFFNSFFSCFNLCNYFLFLFLIIQFTLKKRLNVCGVKI